MTIHYFLPGMCVHIPNQTPRSGQKSIANNAGTDILQLKWLWMRQRYEKDVEFSLVIMQRFRTSVCCAHHVL